MHTIRTETKMGFWSVTSLVAGSQIGSGIFLLPASLALFGTAGLTSFTITATGALFLALVFAKLCGAIPKTGGPHVYVESAFGKKMGFYVAWTYWVISWLSTPIVLVSIVGYLSPLFGISDPHINLLLEIIILVAVTLLNLRGVKAAGSAEFFFTILKILPLLLVPIAGLFYIKPEHFVPFNPTENGTFTAINAAALLTMWGFIGVESATTPAESVHNAKKTIPRAIITGTLIVALVYIFSCSVIMGVIPREALMQSKAPFADAAEIIFGGNWYIFISLAAAIVCLGTLNAWVLTSGQIALGAANDGHLPSIFQSRNKSGAPTWGLIMSSIGMIPMLILTLDSDLINQVNKIIDISVTGFLFVYTLATLAYLKLFIKNDVNNINNSHKIKILLIGLGALGFCIWSLWASGIKMVSLALLIPLSGFPIYWWINRRSKSSIGDLIEEDLIEIEQES